MNPTDAAIESNFILRRLGEPYPTDWFGLDSPWSHLPSLAGLLALMLIGLSFTYLDSKRIGLWTIVTGFLRLCGVSAVLASLLVPEMVVGSWQNVNWLPAVVGVLLFAWSFVVALYARDARTAGWISLPLAVLRASVFALLAFAFLLPAREYWEVTEKRSRVVVVLDVSPSMTLTTDEQVSGGKPGPTRFAKLIETILDPDVKLLDELLTKNPVFLYRFAGRLDDEPQAIDRGAPAWTPAEWNAWVQYDFKTWLTRGVSPAGIEVLRTTAAWNGTEPGTAEWALTWAKLPAAEALPASLPETDAAVLADHRSRLEKRIDLARSIVLGTNVPDSLLALVNRESGNLVQGVIVFSDGRSNLGSDSAYRQLRERAERDKVPIFTVAVGEARNVIGITITDLQAPDRTPPDEAFKIVVEADGLGLADKEVQVKLGLYLPGRDLKENPKPDFELPPLSLKFAGDTVPPHGSVEFTIDPATLPENLTEESKKVGNKRQWKAGEWKAVARIGKDKRELFAGEEHISPPRSIQVLDKPTRILLFAGGPTREYQTLRTLLVRETAQNRAELSICLQSDGGRDGTSVQDVPPERMLTRFPTKLDTAEVSLKPEEKFYNLNEYDLVVAFDPDWSELSADQLGNLQRWVDNLGGGLITVAGPLNLFQLARADDDGRLRPMLDLLPIVPDDIILVRTRPVPRTPRRLLLKPNPQFDVLKLEDDANEDPASGWEPYFTGRGKFTNAGNLREALTPTRGFFSYYPVRAVKPGATVLAEFLDINERGDPEPRPWIVVGQPARGRSVFLASGEIWRTRAYNQDYFDRFWVKLTRYAAGNRDAKASRGRVLVGKEFNSGSQIRVQTRLLAPTGKPYDLNAPAPKFRIEQYNAANEKEKEHGPYEMRARKSGNDFEGYYTGQLTADPARLPPGDKRYRIVVDVPDSAGDKLTGDFTLKRSDPEFDNTRPDYAALEKIAGSVEEVRGRIKDVEVTDKLRGSERDPKKAKLTFRLSEKDRLKLIPAAIDTESMEQRNRGPVRDLWDKPLAFSIGDYKFAFLAVTIGSTRIEIGWVLLTIAALLTVEWLTRKLLRMA